MQSTALRQAGLSSPSKRLTELCLLLDPAWNVPVTLYTQRCECCSSATVLLEDGRNGRMDTRQQLTNCSTDEMAAWRQKSRHPILVS